MPSRLLLVLAGAVALTWAFACSRGAPAHSESPAAASVGVPAAPIARPEAPAFSPATPEPKPSADEIAAIEHPRVAK